VLSPALREWIDCFAPEAVFTLGGSLAILRLAVWIAEQRGIPLIPYFTDDWISCMFQGGPLDRLLRKSLIHWFQRSLKLSSIRLTMCDAMAREYERRYGGRFETFMNPVDPFKPTPETKWPMVRLSFIGALSPNRWQSVLSRIGMIQSAIGLDRGFHAVSGVCTSTAPAAELDGAFSKDAADSPEGNTIPALRAAAISRRISTSEGAPAAI
jgi:hypothetical protein